MSQDVIKGPSAALIIESSQNYFNQRGLIFTTKEVFNGQSLRQNVFPMRKE